MWVHPLPASERLESDDGVGVLDAGNGLHLFVDEVADVGAVVDIELHQQIVVARRGIDFGGDFGFGECVGDGVGLAELAFDLHEEGNHRCRLQKGSEPWGQYSVPELAGNNMPRYSMIRKSGNRFSEKIMLKQGDVIMMPFHSIAS